MFKVYTAEKMMMLWLKKRGWILQKNYLPNAQADSFVNRNILTYEIFDGEKNLKLKEQVFCAGKPQGNHSLSIEVLKRLVDPSKRWLELVDETQKMVVDWREERGAINQPKRKTIQFYTEQF